MNSQKLKSFAWNPNCFTKEAEGKICYWKMQIPSVHWENKLHHSPSMSLILANTHDSNRSHIFLQKLFTLHMENEHLLFKHTHCLFLPRALKKALCNQKWSNSHKPYLSESSFHLISNLLLALMTTPPAKQANSFRDVRATGTAGAGFEYVKINYLRSVFLWWG